MAFFPLFIDLTNKKILIVGGGQVALGKIEVLIPFNPRITVVSPEGHEALMTLERQHKLIWYRKTYEEIDLEGASFVIAATSDPDVNESIYRACVHKGLPVNVVDDPDKCTFIFPSIVKREDLVIGISTSGKYPAFSKAIRKKLEIQFPEIYGELLNRLGLFRDQVIRSVDDPKTRKILLTKLINELMETGEALTLERLEALFIKYELDLR